MRVLSNDEVFELHVKNHEFTIKKPKRSEVGWFSIEVTSWNLDGMIDGKIFIDDSKIDDKMKRLIEKGTLCIGITRDYGHSMFSFTSGREDKQRRKRRRVEEDNYYRLSSEAYERMDFHIRIPNCIPHRTKVPQRKGHLLLEVELCLVIQGYCSNTRTIIKIASTGKKHVYQYRNRNDNWEFYK